jgi:uncharacterized protein (DUF924 family)
MNANDILHFWFEEIEQSQWFIANTEFDQIIQQRFTDIHLQAQRGELYSWRATAKGRLAEVIILDQFSRNMFRHTAQAFAFDSLALVLAQEAISTGDDQVLTTSERSFLYMPFMHSESLAIHNVAVGLYQANGVQANLDFEMKHKIIIEEFGRYPHRNEILGRQSTEAELIFLTQAGSSF